MTASPLHLADPPRPIGLSQRALGIYAAVLVVALGAVFIQVQRTVGQSRDQSVRAAFAERGIEGASWKRVFPGCSLASSGYQWRAAGAHGTLCAGPGERVDIKTD